MHVSRAIGEAIINEGSLTADIVDDYPELLTKDLYKIQRNVELYQ